ncbi:uncharacterized protein A4U43_C05F8800 [Asparagus officinalis]|uniref:Uncharacterized protein n=1 Tax=Asparagus officinalis TaxID=4686 RepID=A0A5P1EQJ5_ASPOF|nr:uncharacterized protein A4U43_C05F8800 [Asparagus officinalis]
MFNPAEDAKEGAGKGLAGEDAEVSFRVLILHICSDFRLCWPKPSKKSKTHIGGSEPELGAGSGSKPELGSGCSLPSGCSLGSGSEPELGSGSGSGLFAGVGSGPGVGVRSWDGHERDAVGCGGGGLRRTGGGGGGDGMGREREEGFGGRELMNGNVEYIGNRDLKL